MTMPHSKRPRRNRVNKLRAKKGLPPLQEPTQEMLDASQPMGVTTVLVPLPTAIRALLTKVRKAAQLRDSSIKASDQLFAGAVLTAILPSMVPAANGAQLVVPPTSANLEQAKKVGKVLARPFNG